MKVSESQRLRESVSWVGVPILDVRVAKHCTVVL